MLHIYSDIISIIIYNYILYIYILYYIYMTNYAKYPLSYWKHRQMAINETMWSFDQQGSLEYYNVQEKLIMQE